MKEAKKVPTMVFGLRLLQKYLMHKYFSTVRLRTELEVHQNKHLPTIYYANHSSRWDHHIGAYISDKLWQQDTYMMIHQSMLNGFPILGKTGCYAVDDQNPIEAARSLKYTKELLTEKPGRAIWIFPQGTIKPNDTRPLKFQNGLALLIRSFEVVRVIPVAFRYDFLMNTKPEAFVSFGKPEIFRQEQKLNSRTLTKQLQDTIEQELDNLHNDIVNQTTQGFSLIVRSKAIFVTRVYTKTNQLWGRFLEEGSRLLPEHENAKTGSRT